MRTALIHYIDPSRSKVLRFGKHFELDGPVFGPFRVERSQLEGYLSDWRRLLWANVGQGQQVLRRLIKGRLIFTPQADGSYTFEGRGTVQPLIAGVVRNLASPGIPSWNQIVSFLQQMAQLREIAGSAA